MIYFSLKSPLPMKSVFSLTLVLAASISLFSAKRTQSYSYFKWHVLLEEVHQDPLCHPYRKARKSGASTHLAVSFGTVVWGPNLRVISSPVTVTEGTSRLKCPYPQNLFFCLIKSLQLFETHCAFLPLFNSNIDLLQAVKVTKSGHHPSHDRASKGDGSIPCLTSQTSLHACLQRLNTMQISLWHQTRIIPIPLLARSCDRWWLDFVTFTT